MKNLETNLVLDKEIFKYYPIVSFDGELVRYDPLKHELEKGESASYLDVEEQKIKEGTIESVEHSIPMNYPIYFINGKPHMYHRVWPKAESNQDNLSAKDYPGIKVNKSKATYTYPLRETQFTKNSRLNN